MTETTSTSSEPRLQAWHRWSDWPLTVLAGLFLVLYAVQVLYVSASQAVQARVEAVVWVIWALFAVDYLARFLLVRQKLRFVLRNPFDLLVVVLPILRPMRVVTVITLLNRRFVHTLEQRVALFACGATMLIGLSASLAVLDAERDAPDATITTFPDAVWWALTTITTVGYGDRYPVTPEGRLVAAALMVGGIALLGVVTGLVASWFVRMLKGSEQAAAERTEDVLRQELTQLRQEIRALTDQKNTGRGAPETLTKDDRDPN
ncbi:potassium channel family protein [Actinophytocola sp.]|uniref:potassium channel family protein n=1 Tax=Actinophytocola sp. TaxID=1872138 RepID=UPI00389B1C25